MKKKWLIFGMYCLCFSASAQTQESTARIGKSFFLEFFYGNNQSTVSGSAVDYFQARSNFYGGSIALTNKGGTEGGLHVRKSFGHAYIKTGIDDIKRNVSIENSFYVVTPQINSEYLAIPLNVGIQSSKDSEKRLNLFVDLGLSYLMNVAKNRAWIDDTFSPIDFVIEGGPEFFITKEIALSLRYKYMADITRAYAFHYQVGDDYNYFYTTATISAALRVKI